MGTVKLSDYNVTMADLEAIGKLSEKGLSADEIADSIEKANDMPSASEVDGALEGASRDIELVSVYGEIPNFLLNALTGVISPSTSYNVTEYIPVEQDIEYTYNGYTIYDTGIAGYDANQDFVESILVANDIENPTTNYTFTISNPNIKYIRATIKKSETLNPMEIIYTKKNNLSKLDNRLTILEENINDDVYVTFGTNAFSVFSVSENGQYLKHNFIYRDEQEYNDVGWYSDSIYQGDNDIVQGNVHVVMIVRDGTSDDNIYIGHGHGCEEELYSEFYIDGVSFDPLVQTESISGKEFKMISYSKYYRPNKANSEATGTSYAVAQLPLEEVCTRHSEITILKNSKITKNHKIKSLVDGLHFRELFTSMQQTNYPFFNGSLITNDKDGTRNHFPISSDSPEPLAPSTVTMDSINYGNGNSFCTKLLALGNYDNVSYLCETTMENEDTSLNKKCNLRAWCTRTTSNKFYFIPINTYNLFSVNGTPYDTFDIGQTISTKSTTKITIR